MINFDAVDFSESECRSEEVMFHLMLRVLHKLHFTKKFTQLVLISNCNGHYVLHFVQACQQSRGGGGQQVQIIIYPPPPPPIDARSGGSKVSLGYLFAFIIYQFVMGKNPLSEELKGRKDLFPLLNIFFLLVSQIFYYWQFHSLEF